MNVDDITKRLDELLAKTFALDVPTAIGNDLRALIRVALTAVEAADKACSKLTKYSKARHTLEHALASIREELGIKT